MHPSSTPPLRLGTRGSELALWQAETVRDLLSRECPERDVELVLVKTLGDKVQDKKIGELGRTGVFTHELDRALQENQVDLAVHSLKDVETTMAEGLALLGVLPRGPVEDALVAKVPFDALRHGARVGTGSVRRAAQLKRLRPDLELIPMRGNVPTRLAKFDAGEVEGLIMARAGLVRLGYGHRISTVFSPDQMLYAVGQGAVALVGRLADASMTRIAKNLNHAPTWTAIRAERACLKTLAGGCNVPLGVSTALDASGLRLRAVVFETDGPGAIASEMRFAADADPDAAGAALAQDLIARGAPAILERARRA